MKKKLSILLPVFNEQENIIAVFNALKTVFAQLGRYETEIIFINDGSSDHTLPILKELAASDANLFYISFSRNFGKDNAIAAGMERSTGDAIITLDADMQHSPGLIKPLVAEWEAGSDVVYYYRENNNKHAGFFSRISSAAFYKLVNWFSNVKLENGVSDFRLIDLKVARALLKMHEDHLFYRGLVKWVGFRQKGLPYAPDERNAGKPSYRKRTLIKLAIHGLTSFSTKPLTFAIYLGFIFSFVSLLYIPYAIISKLYHVAVSGWASVIVTIAFFGGLNLIILGIVGLYLGKTFMQGKGRPLYIIDESNTGHENNC